MTSRARICHMVCVQRLLIEFRGYSYPVRVAKFEGFVMIFIYFLFFVFSLVRDRIFENCCLKQRSLFVGPSPGVYSSIIKTKMRGRDVNNCFPVGVKKWHIGGRVSGVHHSRLNCRFLPILS